MLGDNTSQGTCGVFNGKRSKARKLTTEPRLHSEQIVILRIIKEGMSFWQIRRYLYEIEQSETLAGETKRMIRQLVEMGYAAPAGDMVRQTRKGSIAAAAYE